MNSPPNHHQSKLYDVAVFQVADPHHSTIFRFCPRKRLFLEVSRQKSNGLVDLPIILYQRVDNYQNSD